MTVIPSITPYPLTSQESNVRPPARGLFCGASRLARGDQTERIRIAWRVSTLRGTSRRARERRRRDSEKREVTRVSRVSEEGRWREAMREVAVRRRGEWWRRWFSNVGSGGKPIHLPYSLMKLDLSAISLTKI